MTTVDYKSLTATQALPAMLTHKMFDVSKSKVEPSPVDVFLSDTDDINKLYLSYARSPGASLPSPLGSLVLLGYTSAVESYFRAIVRRTVLIDELSRRQAEPLTLSFGAALHHSQKLLPEALLEGFSFSGRKGICAAFEEVLGIRKFSNEVSVALDEFARVCEIRHCCVHRSGRLGSKNAMRLGLDVHSKVLERPFSPSLDDLQMISDLLRTFVKTINNFLFAELLERTVHRNGETVPGFSHTWAWKWGDDRSVFNRYYDVFASVLDSPNSPPARNAYLSFAEFSGPGGERWLAKRREKQRKAAADDRNAEPAQEV